MDEGGRLARGYARTVVLLRYPIILVWVVLAVASTTLPPIADSGGSGVDGFVPVDNPTVATEIASFEAFGFPLVSRTVLVQRDPSGLSVYTQAESALRALAVTQGGYGSLEPILGALPITNTLGLFPSSAERGTTALTYLFMRPTASFDSQTGAARAFAEQYIDEPEDALVGVTGSIPARVEQARIVGESLPILEIATLAAIIIIVGLVFRAVAAPAIALGTAGLAFVVATRLAGLAGQVLEISIPRELEPLILALLLGVVTDYVIFFLTGMRHELRQGRDRLAAARAATTSFAPIVTVAGLTVAAGMAALLVAESAFFRAFGPAMALAILVALVVSVTLVPALMAVLGRAIFWPTAPRPATDAPARPPRTAGIALMTRRPVAALVVLVCVAGLGAAALPLRDLQLGLSFVPSLPESTQTRTAASAAEAGFAPGILSPTVLLLSDDAITGRQDELARLGELLERQPGVAGVLGPGDLLSELELSVLLAPGGDAARFLVVLDDEPLGADAITTLRGLQDELPALLDSSGLGGVTVGYGGDTALAADLVQSTQADLGRIALAALLVNLLLLMAFLRALVAPLYLLACSVLALCGALGLMTTLFQGVLGHDGVTFYVPFAAAVLLLSLGSDYNIFGVGHVWSQARGRSLREAIITATPQTSRAITAAGITLATSFAMLAVVPLRAFAELGFVMGVGILLDAIVVRSFLVPSLLALVGRVSGWPGHALRGPPAEEPPPAAALDALPHLRKPT